jgi:NAD(P)-dependent dehydrogenase (short-subunit alcohol dehydrogenase family)
MWISAEHVLRRADVTSFAEMEQFAAAVMAAGLDGEMLVCNSGVAIKGGPLYTAEPSEFDRLLQTNVVGVFHTVRAFVPAMLAAASPSARIKKVFGIR